VEGQIWRGKGAVTGESASQSRFPISLGIVGLAIYTIKEIPGVGEWTGV
jgi:hypothetical protein